MKTVVALIAMVGVAILVISAAAQVPPPHIPATPPTPPPPARNFNAITVPLTPPLGKDISLIRLTTLLPGPGQITLDTNGMGYDALGGWNGATTRNKVLPIEVKLVPVLAGTDEPNRDGPKLYDINGLDQPHLQLAITPNGTPRFVVLGKDGKPARAITAEPAPGLAAPADPPAERHVTLATVPLDPPMAGAHIIYLNATFPADASAPAKGHLTLDSNAYSLAEYGDTGVGTQKKVPEFDVILRPVPTERDSGQLYDIDGPKDVKLRLAITPGGTCRFLLLDKDAHVERSVTAESLAPLPPRPPIAPRPAARP